MLTLDLLQLIIVEFFTYSFRVVDMDWDQWMWCLFFGFSELIWGQLVFTVPKSVIPRQIRCCSDGISSNKENCWKKLARIRGISKVRKQVSLVSNASGCFGEVMPFFLCFSLNQTSRYSFRTKRCTSMEIKMVWDPLITQLLPRAQKNSEWESCLN